MSMQALLYDTVGCDAAPVAMIQESIQALEVTGNSHLLYLPPQMLPVCSPLYVNSQRVPFQISLTAQPVQVTQVPYLQLSAYLQDECGDTSDAQVSLLADETIHPIGKFAPQTIRDMRQKFNPDVMQTQQFDENQTPITLYYKATTTGTITVYSSIQGDEASQIMSVPLQQFMDTCFSQESPFPGFSSEKSGRSNGHAMTAFKGLLEALDNTASQEIDNIHSKIARDAIAGDGEAAIPNVDHVASMFSGLNKHIRARSEQGIPISFQITSSTGPQDPNTLEMADQDRLSHDRPHHGKNGHRRPKHHGMDKYLTPCEQSAALLLLALIGAIIMVKMFMVRRNAQRALAAAAPPMQQRPIEKRNKDYVSVPSQSV